MIFSKTKNDLLVLPSKDKKIQFFRRIAYINLVSCPRSEAQGAFICVSNVQIEKNNFRNFKALETRAENKWNGMDK